MGKHKKWTQEEILYLTKHYKDMSYTQIARELGRSYHSVLGFARNNGLVKCENIKWEGEILERMKKLYPHHSNMELAKMFNTTYGSVSAVGFFHQLKKSEEYLKRLVNPGRFKKGSTPANKGKKMAPEVYAKASATMFKKGNLPHNTLYDGAETIRKDKRGVPYVFVRVAKGKWVHKQILVWEKLHGPLPKGMLLRSKDGNTLNLDPDNWLLVTKKQHMDITRYSDKVIAKRMAYKNPELERELLNNPDIIELKRQSMRLKRAIDGRLNDE